MKPLFVDSSYFIAILAETDENHRRAVEWSQSVLGRLFTTEYTLIEVGNALSRSKLRTQFVPYVRDFLAAPGTVFVPSSHRLFDLGLGLYEARPDKTWSLVDCISFVVMKQQRITQALTTDHHFEQAGFKALLR